MNILPTFGQLKNRSKNISNAKCVNCYPCINIHGKSKVSLIGTPGLRFMASTNPGESRGLHEWDGVLYHAAGDKLYSWPTSGGSATYIGDISGITGRVWMINNANNQLLVIASGSGYIFNRSTNVFGLISDDDFPNNVTSCTFLNQYGLVTTSLGRVFYSGVNDFSTWRAADFFTAESNPDPAVAIEADHQELFIYGTKTIEPYYDTGDSTLPFARRDTAIQEMGIINGDTLSIKNGIMFWLDNNKQVRMMEGYSTQIISNDEIYNEITALDSDSATGFSFAHSNHIFYCLAFPTKAFVYDLTTSMMAGHPIWHERQSWPIPNRSRWRANSAAEYKGKVYVGDYINGNIYRLDDDYYRDNGNLIRREMSFQVAHFPDRAWFFHGQLEVEVESGVGLVTGQGSDPQVMMSYSDDNGHTYTDERFGSIGKIGEYGKRTLWRSLGRSRNREYVIAMSDPVKFAALSAHLLGEIGID